ncbi:MAG: hypothetical protein CMJ70_25695 [Planctomycetaceae bacterium]|nr:hypothetical protein [Planctomycetaceae bacterium]|tara:strand:- start:1948 stop:3474 length:1527 start_codon:yes stop_codon:yes gene_type:complete
MPTRRQLLTGLAGYSIAPGLCLGPGRSQSARATTREQDRVTLREDIRPLVQLIENTPRDRCFERIAEQLRRGLPYRDFLAALYLAGIRNVNPQPPGFKFHCVFVIHAAHQMSLDAPAADRLMPLFWALDNFKISQQQDANQGDFQLQPVTGKLPSTQLAWQEFRAAMDDWDAPRADRAIVALVRNASAHEIISGLWEYGARDYRNIGHKAIFVTNTWRTLQTIGWHHAEPALRSLVLGLLDYGQEEKVNGFAFEDQTYRSNLRLANTLSSQMLTDRTGHATDPGPTKSLLALLRDSDNAADVCQHLTDELQTQRCTPQQAWDAIHLAAGELMMRQPGIFGIHTVTSSSALRYAYDTARERRIQGLLLLQAAGWMCQFRQFMADQKAGLNDTVIDQLKPAEIDPAGPDSCQQIFAQIGQDPPLAATQAMRYATRNPLASDFKRLGRNLIFRKATDAHDYKYAVSIFEDYHRVSPGWRPQMLATATYHLRGSTVPDSPLMNRARKVIDSI